MLYYLFFLMIFLRTTKGTCPKGSFKDPTNGDDCTKCSENTYSATEDSITCTKCGSGETSPAGSDDAKNCTCPKGSFKDPTNGDDCTKCSENTYSATEDSITCTKCGSGEISPAGSDDVTDCVSASTCPKGRFKDTKNGDVCTECPENTYSATEDSITCTKCGSGETSPKGSDDVTDCVSATVIVTNKEVEKGTTATLTCTASGLTGTTLVTWRYTSGEGDLDTTDLYNITTNITKTTETEKVVSKLSVKSATDDHTYYCVVNGKETPVILNVLEVHTKVSGDTTNGAQIVCTVTDIIQAVTVKWANKRGEEISTKAGYTVTHGQFDTNKQVSTLALTIDALKSLSNETMPFKCTVQSGQFPDHSPVVVKEQKITSLEYSTYKSAGSAVAGVLGAGVVVALVGGALYYHKTFVNGKVDVAATSP